MSTEIRFERSNESPMKVSFKIQVLCSVHGHKGVFTPSAALYQALMLALTFGSNTLLTPANIVAGM